MHTFYLKICLKNRISESLACCHYVFCEKTDEQEIFPLLRLTGYLNI